ncbi:MAG: hypothetical protein RMJ36_06945, partial [Candidatus Calescibacterium sp.]|nr:hypothetical protein [Candidatus Calescibacterium sp.]MDW8133373.1 hypothetical protein [Candidatus Calescibacterium sp.]
MEVNILEPSIYQKYENFLEKIDYSMLYYSIKYKLFLEELLDCKSKYYIVIENDKIIAVYPT